MSAPSVSPTVLPLQIGNPPLQPFLLPLEHPVLPAKAVVPPEPTKFPDLDDFLPIDFVVCSRRRCNQRRPI
eukprot:12891116-Prorocentrum_lima.AAC.1